MQYETWTRVYAWACVEYLPLPIALEETGALRLWTHEQTEIGAYASSGTTSGHEDESDWVDG